MGEETPFVPVVRSRRTRDFLALICQFRYDEAALIVQLAR